MWRTNQNSWKSTTANWVCSLLTKSPSACVKIVHFEPQVRDQWSEKYTQELSHSGSECIHSGERQRDRQTQTERDRERQRQSVWGGERERERERERDTQRDRERETDRQTDRDRERETERDRDWERERERERVCVCVCACACLRVLACARVCVLDRKGSRVVASRAPAAV